MSMREKTAIWGVLAAIGIIALTFLAPPSVPARKVRAQRITSVNSISSVSFTMTNTNALPTVPR
jgi:hypothetical protein